MRGPFSREKKKVREMVLLELQRTGSGLTEELMGGLSRNGLEISATTVERELQALANAGLVVRSTFARLTTRGYQAAAEIVKRR